MEDRNCMSETMREDDPQFLDDLYTNLNDVGTNLSSFVKICSTRESGLIDSDLVDKTTALALESNVGKTSIESLLEPLKNLTSDQVDSLRLRWNELHAKVQKQQEMLTKAEEEIARLRNQVMHQSTFCASLGAVLGNLVWRASRLPGVINVWLSGFQNKIGEFLCIVNGTFVSFIKTYDGVFPPASSDESQFVLGLCGIVTNISASPQGRQFLVINPNGRDLIEKLVQSMPLIPLSSGSSLKRLIMMILYNVSINQTGLKYLLELRVGLILGQCIERSAPTELKFLCLRLLQSITFELTDRQTINDILSNVPIEEIVYMTRNDLDEREKTSSIANQVLANIENFKANVP